MITYGTNEPAFGLSDEKPANAANGQIYINIDTASVSIYDEENDTWYPEDGT